MKLKYNLQFFAENDDTDNIDDNNGDNSSEDNPQIDASAFADLISERDKKIEQLENEMKALKKSNADLLVRVSTGGNQSQQKTFEENLLDLVGAKPRKE